MKGESKSADEIEVNKKKKEKSHPNMPGVGTQAPLKFRVQTIKPLDWKIE